MINRSRMRAPLVVVFSLPTSSLLGVSEVAPFTNAAGTLFGTLVAPFTVQRVSLAPFILRVEGPVNPSSCRRAIMSAADQSEPCSED